MFITDIHCDYCKAARGKSDSWYGYSEDHINSRVIIFSLSVDWNDLTKLTNLYPNTKHLCSENCIAKEISKCLSKYRKHTLKGSDESLNKEQQAKNKEKDKTCQT